MGDDGHASFSTESPHVAAMMQDPKLQLPASCDPPGPNNPPEQLVWIVFGATGHIGRSVAKAALSHNDLVTAVGRLHEDAIPSIRSSFHSYPSHCLPLLCDVRIRPTVDAVIRQSITHWGRIDIIANCTGYGVIGACEDQDDYDIRNQFETNFFGTLNIIHASLPYFRTRPPHHAQQPPPQPAAASSSSSSTQQIKEEDEDADEEDDDDQTPEDDLDPPGGRYLIFSSTSGALGVPGLGPYSATKHAVEGLIESMLYETHAFNIKATLVEPGHLRRDDPATPPPQLYPPTTTTTPRTKSFTHFLLKPPPPHSPYTHPTSPAAHARRTLEWLGDTNRQPTSAVRSAELVWLLAHCRFPPLRLLLGGFAVESVRDRLRCVTEEIEDWKFLGFGEGVKEEEEEEEAEVEGGGSGGEGEERR
ncbi:MAG: hypothetical protein Q9219_001556 [cf. Caloplaca sp. 3 TL-2023]